MNNVLTNILYIAQLFIHLKTKQMKNWNTNQWFALATVFAFLAFLAWFSLGNKWIEDNGYNLHLTIGGVISIILGGLCLFKAQDTSNN
jgi:hypothetical protein